MTKKHFEDLAEIIRIARRSEQIGYPYNVNDWEESIIQMCQRHNPRFSATTFKLACTPTAHLAVEDKHGDH